MISGRYWFLQSVYSVKIFLEDTMKRLFLLLLALCVCGSLFAAGAGQSGGSTRAPDREIRPGVMRTETLILENPQGRVVPADDFNRWRPGMQSASTGLQQICLDTLWYIDPDEGIDGVWEDALAAEKPIYNADFTSMTVKLRRGIYWSDGVEFTADDLIYTVEAQMKTPGMAYTGQFNAYVDRIEKPDNYTVTFYFKLPNSRFHGLFTVRWSACYIMPKHVFERQPDPLEYKFNPPLSLGPYVLKDFDPNGEWYLWEKRSDWQRTTLAKYGSMAESPRFAMYIAPGSNDVKVAAQRDGDLDVIHDLPPEGMITLARTNPNSRAWFPSFPWGHPDPTLPAVIFNNEKRGLDNRDVRWALTLAIDITRVAMASYRGAATISALHVPPTGMYPRYYFEPLEGWLRDLTLDLGGGQTVRPYDPDASLKIADEARRTLGDMVPTDPVEIRKAVGAGWWRRDLAAAERLMIKAGMRRDARGIWVHGDGSVFTVNLMSEGETRPNMTRGAAAIVECWKEFGINSELEVNDNATRARRGGFGEFDANFSWTIETWGGHPDLFYFLESWHSRLYMPTGENAQGRNSMRWKNPELDRIIDTIQTLDFDDPRVLTLGQDFCKLALIEMPIIPIMSYNVFSVCDETYWTGFPTSANPYTDPVANWGNTRYMFVKIKPRR